MNIDVRCFCGQVVQVTPPPPEDDDGVYVPFDLSHKREHISHEDIDSGLYAEFGRSEGSVTCKCGNTTHVVVKIDVVERQEPVSGEAADLFQLCHLIDYPGGKQVQATENGSGERKRNTYLYNDNGEYYFEQYVSNQHHESLRIASEELRAHVAKLLPLLFTPDELKKLLSGEESPPAVGPPRPMS